MRVEEQSLEYYIALGGKEAGGIYGGSHGFLRGTEGESFVADRVKRGGYEKLSGNEGASLEYYIASGRAGRGGIYGGSHGFLRGTEGESFVAGRV